MAKSIHLFDYLYDVWPTAPLQVVRILKDLKLFPDSRQGEVVERLYAPAHGNIGRLMDKLEDIGLIESKLLVEFKKKRGSIYTWHLTKTGEKLVNNALI